MKTPLSIDALNKYGVNIPGKVEELSWSLYDTQTYVAAGQTNLSFFQDPVGSSGKGFEKTNLELNGQIPKGQNFLVESISLEFAPAASVAGATALSAYADDYNKFINNGYLEFKIGSKLFTQHGPCGLFTQQYGLAGFAATATTQTTTDSGALYATNRGKEYSVIPLVLTSNQNFAVTLKWDSVKAISADATVRARLNGRLFRNAQ